MKTLARLLTLTLIVGSASAALASDDKFAARLSGYNEVHFIAAPTPALRGAVSSPATGTFQMRIDDRKDVIQYDLTYEGLTTDVTQAHIHFGQRHTVGGNVVWLCQTTLVPAPPAVASLTPMCPGPTQGKVSGTITPAQVLEAGGKASRPASSRSWSPRSVLVGPMRTFTPRRSRRARSEARSTTATTATGSS
jgi:hypothetical protein